MVVRPLVVFAACFVACAPATPIASAEPDTALVVAEVPLAADRSATTTA